VCGVVSHSYNTYVQTHQNINTNTKHKNTQRIKLVSRKAKSLYTQKIAAQKLTWTQSWRRKNKKGRSKAALKKRAKKRVKIFKPIAGLDMAVLKKRGTMKKEVRAADRAHALRFDCVFVCSCVCSCVVCVCASVCFVVTYVAYVRPLCVCTCAMNVTVQSLCSGFGFWFLVFVCGIGGDE